MLFLGELEACGIRDHPLNLLASYLADRKQTCQENAKQSGLRTTSCKCGIPQGSILGSLFFLVYLNELPNYLKKIKKFLECILMNLFLGASILKK